LSYANDNKGDEGTSYSDKELDEAIVDAFDYAKSPPPIQVPKNLDLNTGVRTYGLPSPIFGTPTHPPIHIRTPVPPPATLPDDEPAGSSQSSVSLTNITGQNVTVALNPAPFPVTVSQPKPWIADAERLLAEIKQTAEATTKETRYQGHISEVEAGTGQLFPGNDHLQAVTPEVPQEVPPCPIPRISLPVQRTTETDADWAWFDNMTATINGMVTQQENMRNLLTHSIAQNNVIATYTTTVLQKFEEQLDTLETATKINASANHTMADTFEGLAESLQEIGERMAVDETPKGPSSDKLDTIEEKLAGLMKHKGPSSLPQGTTDTINTIARKLATIEQKVAAKVAPNPPDPKNTEPPRPILATKPKTPSPPPQSSTPWYIDTLTNASTEHIRFWAAMVNTGKWGKPNEHGQTEAIAIMKPETDRKTYSAYIKRAAAFHFSKGGSQQFPHPPTQ